MTDGAHSFAFDYGGALALARRLSSLADRWERAFADRQAAAGVALTGWTGPHRDYVAQRIEAEGRASAQACVELRLEAQRWARAWAEAVDEANRDRWLAASALDAAGPPPVPVDLPRPPRFEPTALPGAQGGRL